jgi:hypothetical protein
MASKNADVFKQVADLLDSVSVKYNFQVAKNLQTGKPSSDKSGGREYRMQLINVSLDKSEEYKKILPSLIQNIPSTSQVKFNNLSPNSSKYSSVSFVYENNSIDVVIAKGSNKGENFEKHTVNDLKNYFARSNVNTDYDKLINKMISSNDEFAKHEMVKVDQRTGSTRKESAPIEKLGEIIGDIVITDSTGKKWFISLKDVNGDTFSSYPGASTLFNKDGDLIPKSDGANFLKAFGVDLNLVQSGYDLRNKNKKDRSYIPVEKANQNVLKSIFQRAWGMNYFYVRKISSGDWKVFWIDNDVLNRLTSNIRIDSIKYPSTSVKQVSIYCSNSYANYLVEIRNSKGGEYPNDIKFKCKSLSLK